MMQLSFRIKLLLILLIIVLGATFFVIRTNRVVEITSQSNQYELTQFPIKNYDYHLAKDKIGANPTAQVDFYTLVLSWSPAYCERVKQRNQGAIPIKDRLQCEHRFGWIIHGLWAENAAAQQITDHPRFCQGDLPEVKPEIIQSYLKASPSAHLLQGEWEKHGACIFNQAQDYFAKQSELFHQLVLPDNNFEKKALINWLKRYNPNLENKRISVNKNEIKICYDLDWQVMSCPW
ncbi:ribonuclease [Mergibacter septicus]|uniref:ribonuclease T2 family protein n=1 Tax=Mergibacter septicus TaxID=221402 RepID=UPI001179191D|nr:ribonuclease [Mergibacter septicus]AWX13862.1 ribonuclease [Mergibacter septicus]